MLSYLNYYESMFRQYISSIRIIVLFKLCIELFKFFYQHCVCFFRFLEFFFDFLQGFVCLFELFALLIVILHKFVVHFKRTYPTTEFTCHFRCFRHITWLKVSLASKSLDFLDCFVWDASNCIFGKPVDKSWILYDILNFIPFSTFFQQGHNSCHNLGD